MCAKYEIWPFIAALVIDIIFTLEQHLGYFNHILGCLSCISVTKEYYQIGFLESLLRSFFIS